MQDLCKRLPKFLDCPKAIALPELREPEIAPPIAPCSVACLTDRHESR
jgi:hypothetical protein